MAQSPLLRCLGYITWMIFAGPAFGSPTLFQMDNFESGTTQNWTNGAGAPNPENVSTDGPAGQSDNFLRVTASGGFGAGSKLIVYNQTQWSGNIFDTRITQIEMDLKNFGTAQLSMRIAFKDGYVSKNPFLLAADSTWHHAVFSIQEPDLTKIGSRTYRQVLSSVGQFRILHNSSAADEGAAIASSFGVDNIRAIPDPGSATLFLIGLVVLARRRGIA
jgi:hypothetical protein